MKSTSKRMEFTGERYVPELAGDIALEHRHRYALACALCTNKTILDIACGEGFGSEMLLKAGNRVIGVDVSEEAIRHAAERYQDANLEFRIGSCETIPLPDASVDAVVSFETIEHLVAHDAMMAEIKRVLRLGGLLIISSPDKHEYSDVPHYTNPFHLKELYSREFTELLTQTFKNVEMFGQRVAYGSHLYRQIGTGAVYSYRLNDGSMKPNPGIDRPIYMVGVASDGELPPMSSSLFEQPLHDSELFLNVRHMLEHKITEQADTITDLTAEVTGLRQSVESCLTNLSEVKNVLAEREARIASRDLTIADLSMDVNKVRIEAAQVATLERAKTEAARADAERAKAETEAARADAEQSAHELEGRKNIELRYKQWQIEQLHLNLIQLRHSYSFRTGRFFTAPGRFIINNVLRVKRNRGRVFRAGKRAIALMQDKEARREILSVSTIKRGLVLAWVNPSAFLERVQYFESRRNPYNRRYSNPGTDGRRTFRRKFDGETLVSVIIVNYNGKHHFAELFASLAGQTHRRFEIIVVDNGSKDGSVEYLKSQPQTIKLISLNENLGFAEANNIGAEEACGEALLLLNNDTRAEPTLIQQLIDSLNRFPSAAATGPKIRFYHPFVTIKLNLPRGGGAQLNMEHLIRNFAHYPKFFFSSGFSEIASKDGVILRHISERANLMLPLPADGKSISLPLRSSGANCQISLEIHGQTIQQELTSDTWSDVNINVEGVPGNWLINNAGSSVTEQGEVSDRAFGVSDDGSWDQEETVTALCGCAMMLRREALADDEPLFNAHYFTYFEDTDLSLRLRRKGFDLVYCPAGIVYHKHASTSGENSPAFRYYVNRNRQLFYAANFQQSFAEASRARARDELNQFRHYCQHNAVSKAEEEFAGRIDQVFADWDRLLPLIAAGTFHRRERHFPRLAVYNSFWNSLGGGEHHAAAMAEALQAHGPVDLICENDFDVGRLEQQFKLDLSRCRKVIFSAAELHHDASTTGRYDVFLNSTYSSNLVCHAKRGAYVVSFPFPLKDSVSHSSEFVSSYNTFFANSSYTAKWCKQYWNVEPVILYPSTQSVIHENLASLKTKTILNVGRFFRRGHNKKQLELARAFVAMRREGMIGADWRLVLAGQVEQNHEDYFDEVMEVAKGHAIELRRNVTRAELEELFASAAIYWHATGLDEDLLVHPERAEHFGISVIESMSHGCVPVVIDAGGPPEIVDKREYGFLFSNVAQLLSATQQAVQLFEADADGYERMSNAARARALQFGKTTMQARLLTLLDLPLIDAVTSADPLSLSE
jgi:GT2 family glycosyltransferase/ubiquinone/menaquinone biosynthesis C-methylase UbiE/uncharacterized coiled-coil protein SlyX